MRTRRILLTSKEISYLEGVLGNIVPDKDENPEDYEINNSILSKITPKSHGTTG